MTRSLHSIEIEYGSSDGSILSWDGPWTESTLMTWWMGHLITLHSKYTWWQVWVRISALFCWLDQFHGSYDMVPYVGIFCFPFLLDAFISASFYYICVSCVSVLFTTINIFCLTLNRWGWRSFSVFCNSRTLSHWDLSVGGKERC